MVMVLAEQGLGMRLRDNNTREITVAIWMVTYNHEQFIEQAIESVMMQQTTFNYKLYIGEDCSTDKTRSICIDIKNKYQEKIELYLNEINIGATNNAQQIYKACFNSGAKYIALCEGDDYWTDPLKLQKQVDFLEANLDYSFCGHTVEIFNQYEKLVAGQYSPKKSILELKDTVFGPPMHTSSLVFRNNFMLPKSMNNLPAGDDALECILAAKGKAFCFSESMSVYRLSEAGTWSTISQMNKNYKSLIIQLWIIRNFPLLLLKQARRIDSLFRLVRRERNIFTKNFTFKDSMTILSVIFFYKLYYYLSILKNKLFPK